MDEFALIREVFAPLAGDTEGALNLEDDAAILTPAPGTEFVVTKDMIAAGIHYPEDAAAGDVARRLLRVNLSDLAAMGAEPAGYFLGVAVKSIGNGEWLSQFAAGLAVDQAEFGIRLLGGDTISAVETPVFSLTAVGSVPAGQALRRNGARSGDAVVVSGTIGDAALGLGTLNGDFDGGKALIDRFRLPEPRLALGKALRGMASACIDISDGLLADLAHIAEASGVGATVEKTLVPLSAEARRLAESNDRAWAVILGGGDDYELLFTIAPAETEELRSISTETGVPLTVIGTIDEGGAVRCIDEGGNPFAVPDTGFRHQ